MRRRQIVHYSFGHVLEPRNEPDLFPQTRPDNIAFMCSRLPKCPGYVEKLKVKETLSNIFNKMGEEEAVQEELLPADDFIEEIRLDPQRKDLQTEKENWRLILQQRYKSGKKQYVPILEADQFLTDLYEQKALEIKRAKEKPIYYVLQDGEYQIEGSTMAKQKHVQILNKSKKDSLQQLNQFLQSRQQQAAANDQEGIIFTAIKRIAEIKQEKQEEPRIIVPPLGKLKREETVLEIEDEVTTDREKTTRIFKESVLRFNTYMESGQQFLEFSDLLTGRTQTIQILGLNSDRQNP